MADVFISYKQEDRERAENIALALSDLGLDVWWDFDHLRGAQPTAVMREMIDHCRAVILIWSEHSIANRFIQDEARHAHGQGKLIPVRFSESVEPPVPFTRMETEELHDWSGQVAHEGFSRIVKQVETLGGRKASPDAALPPEAEGARRELEAFKAALLTGSREALEQFVQDWPQGQFAEFARSMTPNLRAQASPLPPLSGPNMAEAGAARPRPARRAREADKLAPVIVGALAAVVVLAGLLVWRPWQAVERQAEQQAIARVDPAIAGHGPAPGEGGEALPLESAEDLAQQRAEDSADADAWADANEGGAPTDFQRYLETHPEGRHANQARDALGRLSQAVPTGPQPLPSQPRGQAQERPPVQAPVAAPANPFAAELLNPEIAAVVARARSAVSSAEASAANAREAAERAELAAISARRGEPGAEAITTTCQGHRCVYETEVVAQERTGLGIRMLLDGPLHGETYRGEWRANQFSGLGVLQFGQGPGNPNNLSHYQGQFQSDRMVGFGILYFANGGRYIGQFQSGQPSGVGKREVPGRTIYEGEFLNGFEHGLGVLWSPQGALVQQGEFEAGRLVRPR